MEQSVNLYLIDTRDTLWIISLSIWIKNSKWYSFSAKWTIEI